MFKFKLALFLLFIKSLQATILDPGVEAVTDGDPSSTLCDSVSILTGDFVAFAEDLVIDGAHPLRIHRQYASGNGKGEHGGWEFFPHLELRTVNHNDKRSTKFRRVIVREPNGTHLVFKRQEKHSYHKKWVKYSIDFEKNGKGISNTSRGTISGRTNLKNYTLYRSARNTLLLICADGTERTYTYSHDDDTKAKMPVYLLRRESHPDEHRTYYHYDESNRLTYIKNTDKTNSEIYASCKLLYPADRELGRDVIIHTSDGRRLSYQFICKGKSSKKRRFFLKQVEGPDLPPESITYNRRHDQTDHLVESRCLPDGRILSAAYYLPDSGHETALVDRVETLYQPLGENGEAVPTHHFMYHKEKGKPGHTDVYDAYQNKTSVYYSSRILPREVIYHDKEEPHHSIQSVWDESGQLLEKIIADAEGAPLLVRKYKYDQQGNVLREALVGNITSEYSQDTYAFDQKYDSLNRLIEKREPTGLTTKISYLDKTPLVEKKLLSDGNEIHIREFYTYDQNHILIEKIIDDGISEDPSDLTFVTFRKIQKIHPKQQDPALHLPEIIEEISLDPSTGEEILISKVHLHYNTKAKVVQKDIYGSDNTCLYSLKFRYDNRGRLIEEKKPEGQTTTYQYDIHNNVIWEENPNQNQTTRKYDCANRLIQEQETTPDGQTRIRYHEYDYKNNKTASIDPFGNKTYYKYDPFGQITQITHPDGSEETFTYDPLGNVTSHTDPNGNTLKTTYNALGKPLVIQHPNGSEDTFEYYLDGKLKSHTNQDSLTIEHEYDALGRATTLHYYDTDGEKIAEETFEYDNFALRSHTDKEGICTFYEYDTAGRKTATQRENIRTEYAYDALGRLQTEKQLNQENTLVTTYKYDLLNQVIEETHQDLDHNILLKFAYTYDQQGNRTSIINNDSQEQFTYDNFNRLICQENGEGHRTIIAYDEEHLNEDGQKVLRKVTTDPMGYRTIETYDVHMRPVKKTIQNPWNDPIFSEEYHLDSNGNCHTQRCHIYEETAYFRTLVISKEYDQMNRVISIQEGAYTPEEKTSHFTYTPGGKLAQTQKPDGTTLSYQYDPLGNLIQFHSSDGTIHYTYEYDLNGNLLQSHDHIHQTSTTRTLDTHGNILQETLANGLTVRNTFDDQNRRTELHLPNATIHYTYDPLNLRQVTALGHTTTYTYDTSGNLLQKKNRETTTYHYDKMHRRTQLIHPHFEQSVLYDSRGNIIEMEKDAFPLTYTYDGLNQLIREKNHTYSYDSYHNRLSKDNDIYLNNTLHAVTTAGSTAFTYDPNGNPIAKTTPTSTTHYKYDTLDRLTEVTQDTTRTTFTYDSLNRRMTKTTYTSQNDTWIQTLHHRYLYDNQRELGAFTKNDAPVELRILGLNEHDALLFKLRGKEYLPIQDLQGNIIRLIALDNSEVHAYQYNAFAEESPTGDFNPWRYCSKRFDPETDLIYFGHRYYDPETGRWLTPDPNAFTDSANLYAFTYNNPLIYYDAYGLLSWPTDLPPRDTPFIKPLPEFGGQVKFFAFEDYIELKYQQQFDSYLPAKYKPPPPPLERSSIFDINGPQFQDKMIMTINGIRTDYKAAVSNGGYISQFSGGSHIKGVHSATFGTLNDLFRSWLGLRNIATEPVSLLHEAWNNYFQKVGPSATILVIAHSRGNIDLRLALFTFDKELRKRIYVVGIAPAGYIDPGTCGGVRHYCSKNDWITNIDTIGARKYAQTIYTLDPHPNANNHDHELRSPTYEEPIIKNIEKYLTRGFI